jgi:hypothetical protein
VIIVARDEEMGANLLWMEKEKEGGKLCGRESTGRKDKGGNRKHWKRSSQYFGSEALSEWLWTIALGLWKLSFLEKEQDSQMC